MERLLLAGGDSVLAALEGTSKRPWLARAWQDVFVDLVQGQLQHLFLSLLARAPSSPYTGPSLPHRAAHYWGLSAAS